MHIYHHALLDSPREKPQASSSEEDSLQTHDAGVRQETPRQQRRQAAHRGRHLQGVGEEVGQVKRDQTRHAGVEAAYSNAEDEHFPGGRPKQTFTTQDVSVGVQNDADQTSEYRFRFNAGAAAAGGAGGAGTHQYKQRLQTGNSKLFKKR